MKNVFTSLKRTYSFGAKVKPQICVMGAGPAGFYAAQQLVKKIPDAQVDIYEKLPVPFGLVRFGVAPDHPEVKNVINTFTKTAEHPNVRFIGNVTLGRDVTVEQLRKAYHAVLLTYGADEHNKLNIPGEELTNVLSARSIVGWYNGTPWDKNLKIDLTGESVGIFGQGNVAVDVARILLSPIDELKKTDITEHALEQLTRSKIKRVHLIGRRGPLQAAFTIKELREMLKLPGCSTEWNPSDFNGVPELVPTMQRPKKRITELMLKSVGKSTETKAKLFKPVFFRSPVRLHGTDKVNSVELNVNVLNEANVAVPTDKVETIPCDLAVTSIGYKSVCLDPSIPFDENKGVVRNTGFKIEPGFYTAGWLATGPTGVILNTMSNAFAAAETVTADLPTLINEPKPGFEQINSHLRNQLVFWKDWIKIDKAEEAKGKSVGKPREKIVDVDEMLKIAS